MIRLAGGRIRSAQLPFVDREHSRELRVGSVDLFSVPSQSFIIIAPAPKMPHLVGITSST